MAIAMASESQQLANFGVSQDDSDYPSFTAPKTENPRVGGSNPPLGTILFNGLAGFQR